MISPPLIFHTDEDFGHMFISTVPQHRNFLVKIDIRSMQFQGFQYVIIASNSKFSNLTTPTAANIIVNNNIGRYILTNI